MVYWRGYKSKESKYFWYPSCIFSCLLTYIINHRMNARRDKLHPLLNDTDCRSRAYYRSHILKTTPYNDDKIVLQVRGKP